MSPRQYNRGTRRPRTHRPRQPRQPAPGTCPMVIPVLPFVIVWMLVRLIAARLLTGKTS